MQRAEPSAYAELSESLFRVRWQRATPRQRDYLAALASLGGHAGSGEVARRAGFKSAAAAAPRRDELIERGLIYSPEYGNVAFTVALFDTFVMQHSGHDLARSDGDKPPRAPTQDLCLDR